MKTYLFTYLFSLLIAVITTPLTIKTARKFNLIDKTGPRKVHTKPIPRIGGVVIFTSTTILMLVMLFLDNRIGLIFQQMNKQILAVLGCGSLIFLVGFIDDLFQLRATQKLVAQIVCSSVLWLVGIRIEFVNLAGLVTIDLGWFSFPVTLVWILAITNSVNLIDGLDGLAAGISAIACITIAIFAYSEGQIMMVILMLALLGSITGFLFFNFNPAKIFMGDCGSMYLGFVLASGSILCLLKTKMMVALALPVLALGLPIFDTAFCMLRRYLDRWGIMSPDRGHLHHRLLDMGLRHRDVVIVMYVITALAAGFGLFMIISNGSGTLTIFISVIMLLILTFRAFGAFKLRESLAKIKKLSRISQSKDKDKKIFEDTFLKLNNDASLKHWWKVISDSSEEIGFSELILTITTRNRRHKFIWQADSAFDTENTLKVKLPIRNDKNNLTIEVDAKMRIDKSLEACGRRLMLFGKLIDRHGLIRLDDKINTGYDSRIIDIPSGVQNHRKSKKWSVVKSGV